MIDPSKPRRLIQNWKHRWAPMWVVVDGRVLSMAEYEAETGISGRMIGYRLHELGWSERDALTRGPRTPYDTDE